MTKRFTAADPTANAAVGRIGRDGLTQQRREQLRQAAIAANNNRIRRAREQAEVDRGAVG